MLQKDNYNVNSHNFFVRLFSYRIKQNTSALFQSSKKWSSIFPERSLFITFREDVRGQMQVILYNQQQYMYNFFGTFFKIIIS